MNLAPTLENAVHCLQWATALACPRVTARLGRVPPKELIAALLDACIRFSEKGSVAEQEGQRLDLDPAGSFRRAQPHAFVLRERLMDWNGTFPLPQDLVLAARDLARCHGNDSIHDWDAYEGPTDAEDWLLWPDATA